MEAAVWRSKGTASSSQLTCAPSPCHMDKLRVRSSGSLASSLSSDIAVEGGPGVRSFFPGGSREWNRLVILLPTVGSYVTLLVCYPMQSIPSWDWLRKLPLITYSMILWVCYEIEKEEQVSHKLRCVFFFINPQAPHSRKGVFQELKKLDSFLDGQ